MRQIEPLDDWELDTLISGIDCMPMNVNPAVQTLLEKLRRATEIVPPVQQAQSTAEKAECPRNDGQYPGVVVTWETDRWTTDLDKVAAERQAYLDRHPGSSTSESMGAWHGPGDPPRTCSYCGGLHPEDAIRLIEAGWEIDPTTKDYKRYLLPPGSEQRHVILMRQFKDHSKAPNFGQVPSVWSPTPPVKLYVYHFSKEQIDRVNALIDARKSK